MNQSSAGYQVLVFVCQVVTFGALAAWWLRGTRPGRDVCKLIAAAYRAPARRRAARAEAAWGSWVQQIGYWTAERGRHEPGTVGYELAQDTINALHRVRPSRPNHCPFDAPFAGFICPNPTCTTHPRSYPS